MPHPQPAPQSNDGDRLAFYALIFFTFIVYIAPQAYFPILKPLRLAQTSAIISGLIYILSASQKGGPIIVFGRETKLLSAIILLACVSVPFSIWPKGSLDILMGQFMKSIIIFILISHIAARRDRLQQMLWFIILFCSFISIAGIKAYFAGELYSFGRIGGTAAGITANPNDMALTLVLALPFALSIFLSNRGIKRATSGLYVLLSTLAVLCTFSRGGFIVLVVSYAAYFMKLSKRSGIKVYFVAIILAVCFLPFLPDGYTDRVTSIFDFSKDATGSAIERKESTLRGIEIISNNPVVGVGLGMNTLALNEMGFRWTRIHNVFLQIGADLGVISMLLFIVLLYSLIRSMRVIQSLVNKSDGHADLLLLAQASEVSLIGFVVAGFFYPIAYNFYFYYLAGFAVALQRISVGQATNSSQ